VKRWKKILLGLAGLFIVALALLPVFVKANTFRPVIEKQLSAALGRTVTLGDLRLPPFSASLVAKDLVISDDPNFSAAPFLTAKELRIGVFLRPLIFSNEVKLRDFEIESPQITVIRAANGTWNFSSIGRRAASGGAGSGSANSAAAGTASGTSKASAVALPELSVGRIIIEDGRVEVSSLPAHGNSSVYEHVNIAVRDFSFASQFPFDLSADLPAGGSLSCDGHIGPINRDDAATSPGEARVIVKHLDPVAAGFLDPNAGVSLISDFDVHAASDGATIITSGSVHIENLVLRKGGRPAPKPLDLSYSGTHRLKEGSGDIQDATVKVGDAAIHVTGTYQPFAPDAPDAANPLLNLKLAGQNLPIDELQSLMTAAGIRLPNGSTLKGGTLSMELAINGQIKALVIAGQVAAANTRLTGFDIGSKIHGIAALSGVKTGETTEFEKLHASLHITNSGVAVSKIDAVIPAMGELSGSGTISAADQLDFNLLAKVPSATGIGKLGVGLLSMLNGSGSASGVPLRVTGTPDDPYITADVGGIAKKNTKSITSIFSGKKK
jgi:AsmA protein